MLTSELYRGTLWDGHYETGSGTCQAIDVPPGTNIACEHAMKVCHSLHNAESGR